MKKYTDEQKQEAMQMLAAFGPAKTKENLGIPATTIYRWRDKLKSLPVDGENREDELRAGVSEQAIGKEKGDSIDMSPVEENSEDTTLMIDLLIAKNHKLARENEQLRSVLRIMLN